MPRGEKLDNNSLYVGRIILLSNTVIHCSQCGYATAVLGDTKAYIKEVTDELIFVSFMNGFITCGRCGTRYLGIHWSKLPQEATPEEKYKKVQRQSGVLN